jgi:hypothetical protein
MSGLKGAIHLHTYAAVILDHIVNLTALHTSDTFYHTHIHISRYPLLLLPNTSYKASCLSHKLLHTDYFIFSA